MSIIIQGYQLREIMLGTPVNEPAKALASGNIFTVSGGRVIVTSLIGTAATSVSGGTSIAINSAPTSGVVQALTPVSTQTSLTAGGMWSVIGGVPSATAPTASFLAAGGFTLGDAGIVLPAGGIALTIVGSYTGTVTWDLTYVPYDTGAFVSAA